MTTAEAPYPEILRQLGRFAPLPDREENMPVKLFRLTFIELTFITWMLIASFVAGIALLVVCHWWWPSGFLKSLADALVIAGIIGLSLELSAANFLIAKVGDALVGKLAGSTLPQELQAKVQQIVRTSIVRENYTKVYSLSARDQKMVIDATISFDVRNYSEKTEEYVPAMDEEEFFEPKFLRLEYKTNDKQYVQTEFEPKPKFEGTRTLEVSGEEKVRLKSIYADQTAKCEVLWKYRVTMPEEFCDVNEFRYATVAPKFRLESKPDGFGFNFVGGNILPRSADSTLWEFADSYIAGQQIRAQWTKENKSNRLDKGQTSEAIPAAIAGVARSDE